MSWGQTLVHHARRFGKHTTNSKTALWEPLPRLEMTEEVHFSLLPCGVMRSHSTENIVSTYSQFSLFVVTCSLHKDTTNTWENMELGSWISGHVFMNPPIYNLVLFVFLFKDPLFNAVYSLMLNSPPTELLTGTWRKLIYHMYFLP